jgi:predicted DNA-binding antitoxin AbrB/MazE fold protein
VTKSIKAIYEDGVFKPFSKVRLKNKQQVKLTVVESEKLSKRIDKSTVNRRSTARHAKVTSGSAYRIVGLFRSGVHDLSKNHDKYLYQEP